MIPSRCLLLGLIVFLSASVPVEAQRRWQRLPAPRDPQFYEPRNKLEEFDGRMETLLIKGRTWVGNLRVQNGSVRVEAIDIRDTLDSSHANGVVITILSSETNAPTEEIRSLIDYDEIDKLVNVLDTMVKAGDSVTKLVNFEERYRTRGDFEAIVYKQNSGAGASAAIEAGFFDRVRLLMSVDDLTKLRWFIAQAKDKLDEAK
ncbi:MAG TPA: hypothetical protein VNG71_10590 [Pyrinomonadaceae bacterium]|nr:hypothetical protein [Pyrinomonadaceae bacterium]